MSVAMMGFVVFIMVMMYVLQSSDPTIRTGGWMAVSKAMSCYMGVLINMSMYSNAAFFLGAKRPSDPPDVFTTGLYFVLLAGWWTVKQVATAFAIISTDKALDHKDRCAWTVESVGTVLSFCSASACMQSWAALQQLGRGKPYEHLVVIGVIPLAAFVMRFVLGSGNLVRYAVAVRAFGSREDQTMKVKDEALAWGAYMNFSEDKGVSLAISHITVQCIRFYMTGEYPTVIGQTTGLPPPPRFAFYLLLCGAGFINMMVLSMYLPACFGRWRKWCKMASGLAVAWCCLYAINWLYAHYFGTRLFTRLQQTCAATMTGLVLMVVLTKLMNYLERHHHQGSRTLYDLFIPISILIGFSWRDAWQGALMVLVSEYPSIPPPIGTFFAGVFFLTLVYPAWKWYILPATFIKWQRYPEGKELGIIEDSLKAEFEFPRWLAADLDIKRDEWEKRTVSLDSRKGRRQVPLLDAS